MSAAGGADGGRRVRATLQEWTSHADILKHQRALTLDHVDVVCSVSDRQRHSFLVLLHQTHDVCLLLGRDPTADDCLALTGHVYKVNLWGFFILLAFVHVNHPLTDAPFILSILMYLSHLLLPVVHGLTILRAAGRRPLAKAT